MSEMVERVRAALERYRMLPVSEGEARVAIETMREPTRGMMQAIWGDAQSAHDVADLPEFVWRDMIDAALSDAG